MRNWEIFRATGGYEGVPEAYAKRCRRWEDDVCGVDNYLKLVEKTGMTGVPVPIDEIIEWLEMEIVL